MVIMCFDPILQYHITPIRHYSGSSNIISTLFQNKQIYQKHDQ